MSQKEKSAELISEIINVLKCPLCKSRLKVVEMKSLICTNNHTFDLAKQGYVNMMTRPATSQYDKPLFEARRKIIMESDLYALLYEKISEVIQDRMDVSYDSIMMLDAGCGEGSHLQRIIDECNNEALIGVGLDISKEGIVMAAKNYKTPIWFVGDLANTPLTDRSCHVILNILSPANYLEFKRVLVPNGLIVKVVPRPNYLKELREVLFEDTDKRDYNNDETVSLFKNHFHLVNMFNLSYTKEFKSSELTSLVKMSPIAWNSKIECMDSFINRDFAEITVDIDILVGVNKQTEGSGK